MLLSQLVLLLITTTSNIHLQAQLSVTYLPDTIFSGSSTSVVEGSVLWLYCEVSSASSSRSVSWSKDGRSLLQDVPHIRLRTSTSSSTTTLLLVLDNVVSSDSGAYQCTAQDERETLSGRSLTVTVLSSSTDGMLRIVTEDPLTMISGPVSYSSQTNTIYPNRTAVNTGANVTLSFTAGHVGDDMNSYTTTTAVWLKDGAPARTTPTDMTVGGNGQLSSTLSFILQESDAGVYQCIFSGSGSQMYGTIPLRLDTGSLSGPERVSPSVVFLTPPEKLVLEVKTSGGYDFVGWARVDDRSFRQNLTTELVNFHEVFVRQPTTTSEHGTYRVHYSTAVGEARILVVPTANPSTAAGTSTTVMISEGGNVNIICTSSGGPLPTVTWTINNKPNTFSQTDVSTNPTNTTIPGHVMSTLHIVNAQYPTHDGVYTCTGTNSISSYTRTHSATITVKLQVVPDITSYLSAGSSRYVVNVTDDIIFQCTATGVPPPDIQWYRGNVRLNSSTNSRYVVRDGSVSMPERSLAVVTNYLVINNTEESDAGHNFVCEALNRAKNGIDMETFELFVQVPPVVTAMNGQILGNDGESILLVFTVTAAIPIVETTNIRWYYTRSTPSGIPDFNSTDFQEITNLAGRTSRSSLTFSPDRLSLTISNIVQSIGEVNETDEGRYFIRVSNPAGDVNSFIDVVVRGPPQIVGGPQDRDVLGQAGHTTTFSCEAIANPPHSISWSHTNASGFLDHNIINISSANTSKYLIQFDTSRSDYGQLTVLNINYEDRGTYTCTAFNSVGLVSDDSMLTVQVAPTFIGDGITSPISTLLNGSVAIFCHAMGFPRPSIAWQKDGRQSDRNITSFTFEPILVAMENEIFDFVSYSFDGNITEVILNNGIEVSRYNTMNSFSTTVGVLLFSQLTREDSGNYTCIASNKLPQTTDAVVLSNSVRLVVLTPAPAEVSIVSIAMESFSLMWRFPFILKTMFEVRIQDGRSNIIEVFINQSNAELINHTTWIANIQGLSPGTRYVVSNRAVILDEFGRGISVPSTIEILTASRILYQIRFGVTTLCSNWINNNLLQKSENIISELKTLLFKFCSCISLHDNLFSNGGFQCFEESPQHVTFRAQLHGTSTASAMELAAQYEKLLAGGIVLNVEAQLINVDSNCPVVIDSLNEAECTMYAASSIPETVINLTFILSIVLSVSVTLILTFLTIVTAVLAVRHNRKKKSTNFKDVAFPLPGVSTGGINDASPEYDYIDTTFVERQIDCNLDSDKAEKEISFTSCTAYGIHKLPTTTEDTKYGVIN